MSGRMRRRRPQPGDLTRGARGGLRAAWLAGRDALPLIPNGHARYAERAEYYLPRGVLEPPAPAGSGWPNPVRELSEEALERHRRALRDRELARRVDQAIFRALGPAADALAIRACDGEIAVEGEVDSDEAAHRAIRAAASVPGTRGVMDRIGVRIW
jgi:hypothetical protein